MLKRLYVKNFTVFAEADFEFGPGLNVVVGTNSTGKSHVLKLGYAVEYARLQTKNDTSKQLPESKDFGHKWAGGLFWNLPSIFAVDGLEYIVSYKFGDEKTLVNVEFSTGYKKNDSIEFTVDKSGSLQIVRGGELTNSELEVLAPVFIPAKEVLTLSWMLPASEQLVLPIEANYIHLLRQLRGLPRRQSASHAAISELTNILGGEVKEEGDKYYLVRRDGQRTEANMLAEGLRKFGVLQKLLSNGSLTPRTTLFWDEPEANLNPALLRKLAAVLAELARQGFQIILATHSLFLLKQLHILTRQKDAPKLPIRYFGLNAAEGGATTVSTKDDFELLPDIVALDEELEQADELEAIFANEDRSAHAAD